MAFPDVRPADGQSRTEGRLRGGSRYRRLAGAHAAPLVGAEGMDLLAGPCVGFQERRHRHRDRAAPVGVAQVHVIVRRDVGTGLKLWPESAFPFLFGSLDLALVVARISFLRDDLHDGAGKHLGQERGCDLGVARVALLIPSSDIGLAGDGEEHDAAAGFGITGITIVSNVYRTTLGCVS